MDVGVVSGRLDELESEIVVVGLFKPVELSDELRDVDKKLNGAISHLIDRGEFTGELKQMRVVNSLGKIPAGAVLLVGLGEKEKCTL